MQDANITAGHANRVTLMSKDVQLIKRVSTAIYTLLSSNPTQWQHHFFVMYPYFIFRWVTSSDVRMVQTGATELLEVPRPGLRSELKPPLLNRVHVSWNGCIQFELNATLAEGPQYVVFIQLVVAKVLQWYSKQFAEQILPKAEIHWCPWAAPSFISSSSCNPLLYSASEDTISCPVLLIGKYLSDQTPTAHFFVLILDTQTTTLYFPASTWTWKKGPQKG